MNNNHLPYNVLLIAAAIVVGLMAVFNLTLRQSDFAVRVGYAQPLPAAPAVAPATPVPLPTPPPQLPPEPLPQLPPEPLPQLPPQQPAQPPPQQLEDDIYEVYTPQAVAPEAPVLVRFPLELNQATSEQLQFIRGIGPVAAGRILEHRHAIGGFTHISQLLEVSGIGPTTFERVTAYLYITGDGRWNPDGHAGLPPQQLEDDFYESYTPQVVAPEAPVLMHFPLELNQATSEQLQLIRGIGPVTAGRILEHRHAIGGFTHISQLLEVSGIGPVTFERVTAYLYITGDGRWNPE